MRNQSHLKVIEEPAESSPRDGATGDKDFLVFLTIIFTAGAAAVLAVVLNVGSPPAVAGTSAKAAVSSAQPAETGRFVPFHEQYGVQPGEPEFQPPTF